MLIRSVQRLDQVGALPTRPLRRDLFVLTTSVQEQNRAADMAASAAPSTHPRVLVAEATLAVEAR